MSTRKDGDQGRAGDGAVTLVVFEARMEEFNAALSQESGMIEEYDDIRTW